MSVSVKLRGAVVDHDLATIRDVLSSSIMLDPKMTDGFIEAIKYVLEHGITESELYEPDDGAVYSSEPTRQNFNKIFGLLGLNFSKKKLDDMKRIALVLYPESAKIVPCEKNSSKTYNHKSSNSGNGHNVDESTSTPLVIGGIVVALIALATTISLIFK